MRAIPRVSLCVEEMGRSACTHYYILLPNRAVFAGLLRVWSIKSRCAAIVVSSPGALLRLFQPSATLSDHDHALNF